LERRIASQTAYSGRSGLQADVFSMRCGQIGTPVYTGTAKRRRLRCGPDHPRSEAVGRANRPAWATATRLKPDPSEEECHLARAPPTCANRAIPHLQGFKALNADYTNVLTVDSSGVLPKHWDIPRVADCSVRIGLTNFCQHLAEERPLVRLKADAVDTRQPPGTCQSVGGFQAQPFASH
jgi:hypothetical protein